MKHYANKITLIILLIVGYLAINNTIALAGIGVSPQIIEFVLPQDKDGVGEYEVSNDGDEAIRVKVDPQDWFKRRLGRETIPIEDWLTLEPMEFEIESKSTQKVEFKIIVPKGYEGELAAMIFFETAPVAAGAFGVASRYGVSLYIAMEGTINLGCNLGDVRATRRFQKKENEVVDQGIMFAVNAENTGNVHIRPTGIVRIKDEDGNDYEIPIERGFPVYSGKIQDIVVSWEKTDLKPGKYEGLMEIDYGNIYNEDKRAEKKFSFIVHENGDVDAEN